MISPVTRSRAEEMLARIKRFATAATKKQMQEKFGICTDKAVGTTVTTLRALVKGLPRPDQDLAEALWQSGIHEARIMASMLADPEQMTREKLDNWASELNSWDICDLCCGNLFSKVKNPLKLAERWIKKRTNLSAGQALPLFVRYRLRAPKPQMRTLSNCCRLSKTTRATRAQWYIRPSTGPCVILAKKTRA